MKKKHLLNGIFGLVAFFGCNSLNAQLVGGHGYMVGDYVQVGVNANGHEGAPCTVDVDCVTNPSDLLGMVANPAMDGWVTINGDFFAMGSPESGFGITYTLGGVQYERNNNAAGMLNDIVGSITDYTETVDSIIVTWVGSVDDLEMTIIYSMQKDQHYYTTTMSVDNLGVDTYTDVYYYRNLDPDNNQNLGGGFATENTIIKQAGMADDSVIVQAKQTMPFDSYCNFVAYGADWRGFYGGFANRNGEDLWNGYGIIETVEGSTSFADVACGVAYKIETLPPGRVASEPFSFAIAFKPNINFSEGGGTGSGIDESDPIIYSIYPNPTNQDFVMLELAGQFTYRLLDLKGSVIRNGQGNGLTKVELTTIEKGLYFMELSQGEAITTTRIIVN